MRHRDDNHTQSFEDEVVPETDDATVTDSELTDEEERSTDTIKKLRTNLKACEAEKKRLHEELQRTTAEFLNSKKRLSEQKERDVERATDTFIEALLPVYDSFHTAMRDASVWNAVDENWRAGIERIRFQLDKLLTDFSVTTLDPLDEAFDPEKHEALGNKDTDDGKDSDTVAEVVQLGFLRNNAVIRPAKVILRK